MARIRALFWDVGGVLLNNAWDHQERNLAIEHFRLDKTEFESRHRELVTAFEEGRLTLDQYLNQTVFYQPRDFALNDFRHFMFSLSTAKSETLELARRLAGKYPMATINNESRELNQYRIQTFGLDDCFGVFVSSCFVGMRKPDERIYRLALNLTQRAAEESCFIDDRQANVDGAAAVGMRAIRLQDVTQLLEELRALGVDA